MKNIHQVFEACFYRLFILFLLGQTLGLFSQKISQPIDSDSNICGGPQLKSYPYGYFLNPGDKYVNRIICVSACPLDVEKANSNKLCDLVTQLDCATNSHFTSCEKSISLTDQKENIIIYDTFLYKEILCLPTEIQYYETIKFASIAQDYSNSIFNLAQAKWTILQIAIISILLSWGTIMILGQYPRQFVWGFTIVVFISVGVLGVYYTTMLYTLLSNILILLTMYATYEYEYEFFVSQNRITEVIQIFGIVNQVMLKNSIFIFLQMLAQVAFLAVYLSAMLLISSIFSYNENNYLSPAQSIFFNLYTSYLLTKWAWYNSNQIQNEYKLFAHLYKAFQAASITYSYLVKLVPDIIKQKVNAGRDWVLQYPTMNKIYESIILCSQFSYQQWVKIKYQQIFNLLYSINQTIKDIEKKIYVEIASSVEQELQKFPYTQKNQKDWMDILIYFTSICCNHVLPAYQPHFMLQQNLVKLKSIFIRYDAQIPSFVAGVFGYFLASSYLTTYEIGPSQGTSAFYSEAFQCLSQICNGKIEVYNYLFGAQSEGKQKNVCLSSKDFSPQYNRNWANFPESEKRGPPGYKYDYYFPRSCEGFGLNIEKYGDNQDWIQMDGNPEEWRILYHGTKQQHLPQIVKNNLKPGGGQNYQSSVGVGIYFSDRIEVCRGYTAPTTIGNKKFNLYFMSRCRPSAVKQNEAMIKHHYFVVNDSKDVRPYRILLEEC